MHNESLRDRESEPVIKPSKLDRIKTVAGITAIFVVPTAVTLFGVYASVKMSKMQLDAAKLNLEAAKLNK
jgi:hypothetical protein